MGKLCSAQILASDSVLMLPELQTAGEAFTACLWHTDEPGNTLLLNYPNPRRPLLPPPCFSSITLSPPPLTAVLPFLPLSLSAVRFYAS